MKQPRIGRPPLGQGESKESRLVIRLKASEEAKIEAAAQRAQMTKSAWVRDILLTAASGKRRKRAGSKNLESVQSQGNLNAAADEAGPGSAARPPSHFTSGEPEFLD